MIWNDFWWSVIVHVKGWCKRQSWRLCSRWPVFHRPLWKENLYGSDRKRMERGWKEENTNKKKKTEPKSLKRENSEKRRRRGPGSLEPSRLDLETSHKGHSAFEGSFCCHHLHLNSLGYGGSTCYYWNWTNFILLALRPFAVTKG